MPESLLYKVTGRPATLLKKETLAQVFSYEVIVKFLRTRFHQLQDTASTFY